MSIKTSKKGLKSVLLKYTDKEENRLFNKMVLLMMGRLNLHRHDLFPVIWPAIDIPVLPEYNLPFQPASAGRSPEPERPARLPPAGEDTHLFPPPKRGKHALFYDPTAP
ncbi:MAG: hypothetical protein IT210_04780 [Armatimonadetes bacterium]|nr:hypothetical protein [Armatimonadota bacterium]